MADEHGSRILSSKKVIDFEKMEWNFDTIRENFEERDRACIMAIPLSIRKPPDCLTWAYSSDGKYSVKTAYMLGKSCNFDTFHQSWIDLWKLETTPKVRHFLWRACTGSLPVRTLLKARHVLENDTCPWCNREAETLSHALFSCPMVSDLWVECGCEALVSSVSFADLKEVLEFWKDKPEKIKQHGAALLWYV